MLIQTVLGMFDKLYEVFQLYEDIQSREASL